MYFKIVEQFGPKNGEAWLKYLSSRGLQLDCFDSVDGILRADTFVPATNEDWDNVLIAEDKPSLLNSYQHALKVYRGLSGVDLVGVDIDVQKEFKPEQGLLGYEVIDSYWDVSILTNWGSDEEGLLSHHIENNGLISSLNTALSVRDIIQSRFPEDSHACECSVWAVYAVST